MKTVGYSCLFVASVLDVIFAVDVIKSDRNGR